MDELISREALVEDLATLVPWAICGPELYAFANGLHAAYMRVKEAPTVAAESVRLREMAAEIERLQAELDAANDLISRAAVWLDLHKAGGIGDVLREFKKHLAAMKEDAHG